LYANFGIPQSFFHLGKKICIVDCISGNTIRIGINEKASRFKEKDHRPRLLVFDFGEVLGNQISAIDHRE
jgi:hypothetical protein